MILILQGYYIFSIPRSDLKDEIELIFEKQKSFNNKKATNEFKEEYIEHFIWKKDSPSYEKIRSIPITSKPYLSSEGKVINIGTEESF